MTLVYLSKHTVCSQPFLEQFVKKLSFDANPTLNFAFEKRLTLRLNFFIYSNCSPCLLPFLAFVCICFKKKEKKTQGDASNAKKHFIGALNFNLFKKLFVLKINFQERTLKNLNFGGWLNKLQRSVCPLNLQCLHHHHQFI